MAERVLRWRSLEDGGLEHCSVRELADSVRVASVLIGTMNGLEFGLSYAMELERDFTFRSLSLERLDGAFVQLVADGKGNWMDGEGRALGQLQDCLDVDISGTPFTNTLPVRRANLQPGVPRSVYVAYIPVDTLLPRREVQTYTRLDADHVNFRNADGSFEQVLEVDDEGFVTDYPTLFRRVSTVIRR
jgi:hypothetical protein